MRLFIGVRLSPEMRDEVISFINRSRIVIPGFKWTGTDNLHFTLKFLGETEPSRLPDLEKALMATISGFSPFNLTLGAPGAFPSSRSARVLWIGVNTGADLLCRLAAKVETSCLEANFPPSDKPFQPHLTIARVGRDQSPPRLPEFSVSFNRETIVSSFELIESDLRPSGPIYHTRGTYHFSD